MNAVLDEVVQKDISMSAARRARARAAFLSMRATAAQNGFMSDEDIESEIASSRRERRGG